MRGNSKAFCFLVSLSLALAAGAQAQPQAAPVDWKKLALNLHSEDSAEFDAAVRGLRALPGLDATLRKELDGENQEAALDVIAALSYQGLIPDLLRSSEKDDDGFVYACLNSLLTRSNRSQIVPTYLARIEKPGEGLTSAAKVEILEGLQKAQAPLPARLLEPLLGDQDYQVRISAAEYLESVLPMIAGKAEFVPLLKKSLTAPPYQLRLASIRILRSLGIPFQSLCKEDPNAQVRSACQKSGGTR